MHMQCIPGAPPPLSSFRSPVVIHPKPHWETCNRVGKEDDFLELESCSIHTGNPFICNQEKVSHKPMVKRGKVWVCEPKGFWERNRKLCRAPIEFARYIFLLGVLYNSPYLTTLNGMLLFSNDKNWGGVVDL